MYISFSDGCVWAGLMSKCKLKAVPNSLPICKGIVCWLNYCIMLLYKQ